MAAFVVGAFCGVLILMIGFAMGQISANNTKKD